MARGSEDYFCLRPLQGALERRGWRPVVAEGGILPVTPQDGRIGFTAHRPNLARRQMLWPLYGAKRSTGELTRVQAWRWRVERILSDSPGFCSGVTFAIETSSAQPAYDDERSSRTTAPTAGGP